MAIGAGGGEPPTFDVTVCVSEIEKEAATRIRVGVSAAATITTYENPTALVVPARSVIVDADQCYVYRRAAAGVFEKTTVEAGVTSLDSVEILEGLTASDVVVFDAEDFES